jgi:hypothetical protein
LVAWEPLFEAAKGAVMLFEKLGQEMLLKMAASENRNGNRNESNPETKFAAALATNALLS